jgi:hypothetical protein
MAGSQVDHARLITAHDASSLDARHGNREAQAGGCKEFCVD